jgi:hypothetical protein
MIEPAAAMGAAPIVQEEVVSIGLAVEADPVIWTARRRTGRVVIFRASGSRAFRAVALIVSEVAAHSEAAVIALVEADSVAVVIDSAVAGDLGAAALAASVAAVAGSGAGAENKCLESPI